MVLGSLTLFIIRGKHHVQCLPYRTLHADSSIGDTRNVRIPRLCQ